MTRKQILRLPLLLKSDGPWIKDDGTRPLTEAEQNADALEDPAIGWRVIDYFASRKKRLPACIQVSSLRCTYHYLAGTLYEPDAMEALALKHRPQTAAIANALLLSSSMDLETAAKWIGVRMESLKIYADLFFNVRERFDEPEYLRSVVYPKGRLAARNRKDLDEESFGARLLRLAYEHGPSEVIFTSGLTPQRGDTIGPASWAQKLEEEIIRDAALAARDGYPNEKDFFLVRHAIQFIEQRRRHSQSEFVHGGESSGLDGMSAGRAVLDTILAITSNRRPASEE